MNHPKTSNLLGAIARAAALALVAAPAATFAQAPDATSQRIESLAQEIERLKAQLQQMKQERKPAAPAPAPAAAIAEPAPAATVFTSYGEMNYNRPKDKAQTQADLRRFVLGVQHRFDGKTKLVAELEVEHAVTSATDAGEVALEQLYIERRLNDRFGVRGGLVLVPLGLLNLDHEPVFYYGVERNFVETAIIPSTWREGAIQVFGNHDNGISWTAGIGTGFDLGKWDATSAEGRESPLASIHQELQLAKARDLAVFGSVDWRGIPGLRLGAGAFTGKVAQGAANFAAPNARVTLWDLHAKWTPGPWDLSAVYARGTIGGVGDLNLTFAGAPTPVPNRFDGAYVQAAYRMPLPGDMTVAPFARYERFNTARGYDGLPQGLNPGAAATESVSTAGVNFYPHPGVVLKADIQRFKVTKASNRFDLGLGYAF